VVAHLLRLRLDLLVGSIRGGGRANAVIGLVLLVVVTTVTCAGVLSLADAEPERAQALIILGGSVLVLGCMLGPIVLGIADPLDPRRFGVFGLSPRALTPALALAGLISIPVLALLALLVCVVIVWHAHGVALPVAILAAALGLITCVLSARCSHVVGTLVFRPRHSRELSGVFVLILLIVVVPAGVFVASLQWRDAVPEPLAGLVTALAFTPWGAAWTLPAAVATGSGWFVGAIAVLTAGLLWAAWTVLVAMATTRTERPTHAGEHAGLGWFALLPGTPAGAIAARSLVYGLRDRRYLVNLVIVPVAAALVAVPLLVAGVPAEFVALLPVPIVALFLGWLPHNDVAYDSTAVWMHIAGGVRGVADRVGRLAPILLVGIPLLAIVVPVSAALHGDWSVTPALVGIAASLFLSALGLSSIASAVAPYAVARPGDSPFQQPQRHGSSGVLAQGLVMVGAIVVSLPVLLLSWQSITGEAVLLSSALSLSALWTGLGTGVGVLIVGVIVGGWAFNRRGDRIMEFAETA